jgi:hypothetical protein
MEKVEIENLSKSLDRTDADVIEVKSPDIPKVQDVLTADTKLLINSVSNDNTDLLPGKCGLESRTEEEDARVRFFLVGDIGEEGKGRARVADCMAAMQNTWRERREHTAVCVISTGDNVYDKKNIGPATLSTLANEMLNKLPLPWLFCLGNHDVKPAKLRWHQQQHGTKGEAGWSFWCPAPSFSAEEAIPGLLKNIVDISIINTCKLQSGPFRCVVFYCVLFSSVLFCLFYPACLASVSKPLHAGVPVAGFARCHHSNHRATAEQP